MKKSRYAVAIVFIAFITVFAVLLAVLPKQDYSQNEKKVLASFPEFSAQTLMSGDFSSGIDTFTSDQFPFRETFVGISSYFDLLCGRNGASGVYKCADGYLIATPETLDKDLCARNITRLCDFAQDNSLPATMMIVPNAGYILKDELPANHESYPDDEIYDIAQKNAGKTDIVDLREVFKGNLDKQIYYKTDHHVTTQGAYLMYTAFCEKNGLTPVTEFSKKETLTDFYGTNYSKSGLWAQKPDDVEIWHSANNYKYEVTIDDVTKKQTYDSLYFYDHDKNMDKYPVFLDGNHAVVTVKNEDVKNGKSIMILKDSYAHCFATFLCENYEEVVMVDMRYYRGNVSELAKEHDTTELLILYGANNISDSTDVAWLQ